ncbi:hypothetical protein BT69DRAFT_1349120 [Atractiella rhizophila]|nr:hypothetical protein BT69DRAFT_1349120 [Atractiella rhizophila]
MSNPSDPSPQSDADKIRLKRLAKLQSAASTPAQWVSPTPSPAPGPASTSTSSARVGLGAGGGNGVPPKTKAPPAPSEEAKLRKPTAPVSTPSTTSSTAASASARPAPSATSTGPTKFPLSLQKWQDTLIQHVFQITFDREKAEKSNWEIVWMKELGEELTEENVGNPSFLLNIDSADRILFSRLSLSPDSMTDDPEVLQVLASLPINEGKTVLDYLVGCWMRVREGQKDHARYRNADPTEFQERSKILDELKGMVLSYAALSMTEPEMLPQPSGKVVGILEFLPLLLAEPSSSALTKDSLNPFLSDFTAYLTSKERAEEISPIISPLVRELNTRLASGQNGDLTGLEWRRFIEAMVLLSEIKGVAAAIAELLEEGLKQIPAGRPQLLEVCPPLGLFFGLSTFPDKKPQNASTFFPQPSNMNPGDIHSAFAGLRGTSTSVQNSLFTITNNIVRSGPKAREHVINYWCAVLRLNEKRAGAYVDPRTVSSDGFMVNILAVLLGFAGPIIDPQYSKVDKIDPLYFKGGKRLNLDEETKINATSEEAKEYYAVTDPSSIPSPNFISDVFFLTCSFMHLGLMKTIGTFKRYSRRRSDLAREYDRAQREESSWRGTPQEPVMRVSLERLKSQKDQLESFLMAMEAQLLHPEFLAKTIGFLNLAMTWLVRLVDPKGKHPNPQITLPLPVDAPAKFRMLPEYILEDIAEFFPFVSNHAPQVLANQTKDELLTFILVFLASGPEYIKNPYLRGQLVEVIYLTCQPIPGYRRGTFGDAINYNPMALKYLSSGLITIYIDIETTGSHSQFYDKFNTRFHISQIFRFLWDNPTHREALREETKNLEHFVRFVNLMMNDTTYVLDESLSHLAKIYEFEKRKARTAEWEALTNEEREDAERGFGESESRAKGYLDLCNENLHTLKAFTAETKAPFLTPEIVDRLAAMLDFNLDVLAGPKCQTLSVSDKERYRFRPKQLLDDILSVYVNLAKAPEFVQAISRDGRSYSKGLFERAEEICRKKAIKSEEDLQILRKLVSQVEDIRAQEAADEEMGDYPDEFLDPLTYVVMRDPVTLPGSKAVVDRSTIKQHLLSDPTDPFNRQPLKIEQVIPNAELLEKINTFLAERKQKL